MKCPKFWKFLIKLFAEKNVISTYVPFVMVMELWLFNEQEKLTNIYCTISVKYTSNMLD